MGGRSSTLNKLIIGVSKSGSTFLDSEKAEKKLRKIFDSMDKDGSGFLEAKELQRESVTSDFQLAFDFSQIDLHIKGNRLTSQKFQEIVKKADCEEKDGKLSFEEFKMLVKEISAELDSKKVIAEQKKKEKVKTYDMTDLMLNAGNMLGAKGGTITVNGKVTAVDGKRV